MMALNTYRDEAGSFLKAIGAADRDPVEILAMLDEETLLLKQSIDDPPRLGHQVYDVMFLLMELAARFGLDLDAEWEKGRERKQARYLQDK